AGNIASSTRIVNVNNPVIPPVILDSNSGGYYGGGYYPAPSNYVIPPTINPIPVVAPAPEPIVVESPVVRGRVLGVDTSEDETTDSTGGATSTSDEIINNQSATVLDASEDVNSGLLMWILIWLILLIILICLYIIYKRRKRKQN
ncbi:MAG: hypothetical protein NTU76_03965, partial [Candidatus Taylorbacteria bacterium]|nr:hypothetical protein [Candidatus Taylorbacteria bacterium]